MRDGRCTFIVDGKLINNASVELCLVKQEVEEWRDQEFLKKSEGICQQIRRGSLLCNDVNKGRSAVFQ